MIALLLPLLLSGQPSYEPGPATTCFVNDTAELEMFPGWPLIIVLNLKHPDEGAPELRLVPRVNFVVLGDTGELTLPLLPLEVPTEVVLRAQVSTLPFLKRESTPPLRWWISPASTLQLKPGIYSLEATLDTRREKKGWRGKRRCSIELKVREAPGTVRMRVERLYAWDDLAQAVPSVAVPEDELDALLKEHPTEVGALRLKGHLLEDRGEFEQAGGFYRRAIDAHKEQNPHPQEPFDRLYRDLERVSRQRSQR
jgi:hypothetical protein